MEANFRYLEFVECSTDAINIGSIPSASTGIYWDSLVSRIVYLKPVGCKKQNHFLKEVILIKFNLKRKKKQLKSKE